MRDGRRSGQSSCPAGSSASALSTAPRNRSAVRARRERQCNHANLFRAAKNQRIGCQSRPKSAPAMGPRALGRVSLGLVAVMSSALTVSIEGALDRRAGVPAWEASWVGVEGAEGEMLQILSVGNISGSVRPAALPVFAAQLTPRHLQDRQATQTGSTQALLAPTQQDLEGPAQCETTPRVLAPPQDLQGQARCETTPCVLPTAEAPRGWVPTVWRRWRLRGGALYGVGGRERPF